MPDLLQPSPCGLKQFWFKALFLFLPCNQPLLVWGKWHWGEMWLQELRGVAQSGWGCPAWWRLEHGQRLHRLGRLLGVGQSFSARRGHTGWEKCQQGKVVRVTTGFMDKDSWLG